MKASIHQKNIAGFSLVEVTVAMFIFVLLAIALTKSMMYAQQMAEDNLYEATALTVASSFIEQAKGVSYINLSSPKQVDGKDAIEMVIGNGQTADLILDEPNELKIPIVTEPSGSTGKTMELRVTPSITEMDSGSGYWIEVEYEFEHPKTKRARIRSLRNARSAVSYN